MDPSAVPDAIPELVEKNIDIFACPKCAGVLEISKDRTTLACAECKHLFKSELGVPQLFWPNDWDGKLDVTDRVKSFYEDYPFPNYDDVDSRWSLQEKAERGSLGSMLDREIPHDSRILDAGCGTGQMSNYLGLRSGRTVIGADLCLNSLKLGQIFRQQNQIENTCFTQMNLFRPPFRPESFDLVISNGVLHHTSDPFLGLKSLSSLVKRKGYIVIGLYNTYGRIPTQIKAFF